MRNLSILSAAALAIAVLAVPELAYSDPLSSGWVEGPESRVRIIAKPWDGKSAAALGVQIEMTRGWKTYWRNPGDAGVPPRLVWKGSDNITTPRLSWPAPERMADEYGVSIGYKYGTVLPVRIEAAQGGRPMKLALEINYGVCADVCIPVTANLQLELKPEALAKGPHDALIEKARARVPQKKADDWFSITAFKPWTKKGISGYEVEISAGEGIKNPELFVEGPRAYYFSVPELVAYKGGHAKFRFEVDGISSLAELRGKKLTFTYRDANRAAEKPLIIE